MQDLPPCHPGRRATTINERCGAATRREIIQPRNCGGLVTEEIETTIRTNFEVTEVGAGLAECFAGNPDGESHEPAAPFLVRQRSRSASASPRSKPRDRESGGPSSIRAASFFSLATSRCPPGSSTIPSPRDPFGSDHARAISARPSTASSMDAITFDASGSMNSTREVFPGGAESGRGHQRRQPRSAGHPREASNRKASKSRSYASRFGPYRFAAGKTTRSWTPGRQPRSKACDRFGCGVSKCQRPREAGRRPHGTLAAGSSFDLLFSTIGERIPRTSRRTYNHWPRSQKLFLRKSRGETTTKISFHTLRQHAVSAVL